MSTQAKNGKYDVRKENLHRALADRPNVRKHLALVITSYNAQVETAIELAPQLHPEDVKRLNIESLQGEHRGKNLRELALEISKLSPEAAALAKGRAKQLLNKKVHATERLVFELIDTAIEEAVQLHAGAVRDEKEFFAKYGLDNEETSVSDIAQDVVDELKGMRKSIEESKRPLAAGLPHTTFATTIEFFTCRRVKPYTKVPELGASEQAGVTTQTHADILVKHHLHSKLSRLEAEQEKLEAKLLAENTKLKQILARQS